MEGERTEWLMISINFFLTGFHAKDFFVTGISYGLGTDDITNEYSNTK